MRRILAAVLLISLLAWAGAWWAQPPAELNVWTARDQLILLTGLGAYAVMTLIMLLAVRPMWLETRMGGLDKMYRLHKWSGILAAALAAAHYLIKLGKPLLLALFDPVPKTPRAAALLDMFRGSAKDIGEWALWILAAMVLLTLWRRFPYHIWRQVHRIAAVIFLVVAFHGVVLTPAAWWWQPAGWLVAICTAVGTVCALMALTGNIGRGRRYRGQVLAIDHLSDDILALTCRVEGNWHHRAGQFAFLTTNRREGAHPYTVSGADDGTGRVQFSIKALGDYTRRLQRNLQVGQDVIIEGPYGCFDFQRDDGRQQIWVAAGIGVTPFISWMESLQTDPDTAPVATLYYCARNADDAPFADHLKALCARVPNVTLDVRYSETQRPLTAAELAAHHTPGAPWPSVWFCGPAGFADALKDGLHRRGMPVSELFHQEAFQMR
ncbi:ferric reductase-like transmembrane domain-containing protein [Achromobacter sp. SD115]|uniref:ferredoxin reductase family protein n=1 Tax=Achromobacter sp. SD115 TaxID=2782011 RepID=UPI001A95C815|nr:ferric reductase-like transmembrane domain-containing protein [Achromobacter sp. SD115]MBO1012608.1 ferric reductase-like transmembrane domain-containing protein [Achromobacter sp. SD115]